MATENEPAANPPTVEDAAAQTAATAGHGGTTAVTAQESAGLPQFQFQHWAGQIVYLLILFAMLYILMSQGVRAADPPRVRRARATIAGALVQRPQVQAEAAGQAEAAAGELAEARAGPNARPPTPRPRPPRKPPSATRTRGSRAQRQAGRGRNAHPRLARHGHGQGPRHRRRHRRGHRREADRAKPRSGAVAAAPNQVQG